MKTEPIEPAAIEFDAEGLPHAPRYGDLYHPRIGALAQARHVFLRGNGLPERWRGRADFVVFETGFGLGNNFIAAWDAWRADPDRCTRLHYVAIERHPPLRADLERIHASSPLPELARALIAAWPAATPNLHAVDFDGGRVRLLLAYGDIAALTPGLRLQADAYFLDGFAPARNPAMWQPRVLAALGRKAAPGATLATWSVARELRDGLVTAGFEVAQAPGIGGKREITVARWAPRHAARRGPSAAIVADAREAAVVGAGLAGAAAALALARLGIEVTVVERHPEAALESSGNPAGLFHGTVIADDGSYARLYRAAALQAQRDYGPAVAGGGVAGSVDGLLRIDRRPLAEMRELAQRQGLPADYVRVLGREQASLLAGVPLPDSAWHYPGGGWISPAQWVRQALATPGIRWCGGRRVAALARDGSRWVLRDDAGAMIAGAPLLVLAQGAAAARLLAPWGAADWPLEQSRGQVSYGPRASALQLPVAGDGYAIPTRADGLLCGATREPGEPGESSLAIAPDRQARRHNLERLRTLTGIEVAAEETGWQDRVGWRLHTDDRLPIAGALAAPQAGDRLDQGRLLRREAGLFVLTALGARGLTLAPLLGRLVAAQATGTPWPLEQDLADVVDPARWLVRRARRG